MSIPDPDDVPQGDKTIPDYSDDISDKFDGGANNFVQIATLTGITGLTDEAALVTSGNLVV